MITKSEWQAVNQQMMADDRRRVGEPPTAEEILAYTRGELTPEEEARVRERLVCYPDLVRTLTAPFPIEGAEPGDPDFLPDEELARHWEAMRKRVHHRGRDEHRVLRFWRVSAALAAAMALLFGVLLWQTALKVREPRAVWEEQVLLPDGRRGPAAEPVALTARGDSILLVMPLIGPRNFDAYRIEIVEVSTKRPKWSSSALTPGNEDALAILVGRSFLKPGRYQVVVYGRGAGEQLVATYSLSVPAQ
jgi:hypothetical protein